MTNYLVKSIDGLVCDNEKIYFISAYVYAILAYDYRNKAVEILDGFPREVQVAGAFEKIVKHNRKLFLFPCYADDIYSYDLDKKDYHGLNAFSTVIDKMSKRKILEVLTYLGKIYCVCRCPNMVICIDPDTDKVQVYMMPLELLKEKTTMDKTFFSVLVKDSHLIFPHADNTLIEFSLEQHKFQVIYLSEDVKDKKSNANDYISRMCLDNANMIWMCSMDGQIFKLIDNKKIKIRMPDDFIGIYNDGFHEQSGVEEMLIVGNDLFFLLRSACKILKYNITAQDFFWYENSLAEWKKDGRQIAFFKYTRVDDETFWIYNKNDNAVYKWNCVSGFMERIEFRISINTLFNSRLERNCILNIIEKENDINGYILYMKHCGKDSIQKTNINCGESIYLNLR